MHRFLRHRLVPMLLQNGAECVLCLARGGILFGGCYPDIAWHITGSSKSIPPLLGGGARRLVSVHSFALCLEVLWQSHIQSYNHTSIYIHIHSLSLYILPLWDYYGRCDFSTRAFHWRWNLITRKTIGMAVRCTGRGIRSVAQTNHTNENQT